MVTARAENHQRFAGVDNHLVGVRTLLEEITPGQPGPPGAKRPGMNENTLQKWVPKGSLVFAG